MRHGSHQHSFKAILRVAVTNGAEQSSRVPRRHTAQDYRILKSFQNRPIAAIDLPLAVSVVLLYMCTSGSSLAV